MELFRLLGTIAIDNTEANNAIADTSQRASDSANETESAFSKIGSVAKTVAVGLGTAGVAIGGAFVAAVEGTREYRAEMGLLESAFLTAGHSTEEAKQTYSELNAVLGDSGQAVEASQHLAKIADNEKELTNLTDILTGVYATFGESLPLEGLAEGINHSASLGEVQGSLADALEWSGITVEDFNEKLAKLKTEEERQDLIVKTLEKTYSSASTQYKETNKDIIESRKAQERLTDAMAEVGRVGEPIMTAFKNIAASLAEHLAPALEAGIEKFKDASTWIKDNEQKVQTWIGVILGVTTAIGTFLLLAMVEDANKLSGAMGQAAREGDGWENVTGNLKESWTQFLAVVGTPVLEKIVPVIQSITDGISGLSDKMKDSSFEDFKSKIASMIPESARTQLLDYAEKWGKMASNMKDSVFTTFSDNFNKIKESGEKLAPVMKNLTENGWTVMLNKADTFATWCNDVFIPAFNTLTTIFTDLSIEVTEKVAPVISNISDKFTELHTAVTDAVNEYIMPAINDFITMVQELWTENEDTITAIAELFEAVFTKVQQRVELFVSVVKNYILPFVKWLVSIFKLEDVKAVFQGAIDTLGGIVKLFTALLKGDFKGMASAVKQILSGMLNTWKAQFNLIKGVVSSIGSSIASKAGEVFGNVVSKIREKIDKAKTTVSDGLDKIKGFFDKLKLKLPHIKLPHFKLNGEFDLGKGKVPSIGVEWYAKGAVLNRPTAFGINPATGKMMVGGEAGAEAVAPIDVLQNYVRQAVMEANATNDTGTIIKLLMQMIELLTAIYGKDTSLKIDGREFGRMVNKYA